MLVIQPERPKDGHAVEALLDHSFGPGRQSKVSYGYRQGRAPIAALSLVAREAGRLVGTIRFWPVLVGATPALLLGPLGVAADHQGTGIGRALIRRSLERARRDGHAACVLVGDMAYYGPLGFAPAAPCGITMPGEDPARLLVRAVAPGGLAGLRGQVRPWPLPAAPATAPAARDAGLPPAPLLPA